MKNKIWHQYASLYEKNIRMDRNLYAFLFRHISKMIKYREIPEASSDPGTPAKHEPGASGLMTAADYAEDMIREAKKGRDSAGFTFEVADAADFPCKDDNKGEADAVLPEREDVADTGILSSFECFCEAAEEEVRLLPEYVWKELNGGVICDASAYLHPGRVADDLYILGTYSNNGIFGKQIILYYGSFLAVFGNASDQQVRKQLRETIRHEFRHHLETRAGLFGKGTLIEEDANRMIKYYMRHKEKRDSQ